MTPEMQQLIASYVERGWRDASCPSDTLYPGWRVSRPAYLSFVSEFLVQPLCEVQCTCRCSQLFRGEALIVTPRTGQRFELIDLKVGHCTQFRSDERLNLSLCLGEKSPELIQWPLELSGIANEISAKAVIPSHKVIGKDDPGADFEMILLGQLF